MQQNKKQKRRITLNIIITLTIFLLMLGYQRNVFAATNLSDEIPDKTDLFYVNDFAHILSESTISKMVDRAKFLTQNIDIKPNVVLSTVSTYGNINADYYAALMHEKYGMGDYGVLILYNPTDNSGRLFIGKEMRSQIVEVDKINLLSEFEKDLKEISKEESLYHLFKRVITCVSTKLSGIDATQKYDEIYHIVENTETVQKRKTKSKSILPSLKTVIGTSKNAIILIILFTIMRLEGNPLRRVFYI